MTEQLTSKRQLKRYVWAVSTTGTAHRCYERNFKVESGKLGCGRRTEVHWFWFLGRVAAKKFAKRFCAQCGG
jgi:hypothetical protein